MTALAVVEASDPPMATHNTIVARDRPSRWVKPARPMTPSVKIATVAGATYRGAVHEVARFDARTPPTMRHAAVAADLRCRGVHNKPRNARPKSGFTKFLVTEASSRNLPNGKLLRSFSRSIDILLSNSCISGLRNAGSAVAVDCQM